MCQEVEPDNNPFPGSSAPQAKQRRRFVAKHKANFKAGTLSRRTLRHPPAAFRSFPISSSLQVTQQQNGNHTLKAHLRDTRTENTFRRLQKGHLQEESHTQEDHSQDSEEGCPEGEEDTCCKASTSSRVKARAKARAKASIPSRARDRAEKCTPRTAQRKAFRPDLSCPC